jgi:hypothetical protein
LLLNPCILHATSNCYIFVLKNRVAIATKSVLINVCHERQLQGLERKAKVEGSQLRLYKAKEGSRKQKASHA